ncbi:MAG: TolC family protein [Bacteroidales bacterium]
MQTFRIIKKTFLVIIFFFISLIAFSQRELTWEECKELALSNNREINISKLQVSIMESTRKASYTKFLPSFDFTGGYVRMNKQFNLLSQDMFLPVVPSNAIDFDGGGLNPLELINSGALVSLPDGTVATDSEGNFIFRNYAYLPQSETSFGQQNNFLGSINLKQPLFTGGKIKAQYEAASILEDMAHYDHTLTQREVVMETATLFWKMVTLQEKTKLANQYEKLLEKTVSDIKGLVAEGIVHRSDLLKAQVKHNEATLERIKAQNGIARISMALCRMTGLPLTTNIEAKADKIEEKQQFTLEELTRIGLKNRTEILLAQKQTELDETLAKLAKANFYPDIAMGAAYFASNPNPYNGFEEEAGHDWIAGITMKMPIYNWGEKKHMLQAARNKVKAGEIKKEDVRQLIQLDIANAYYQWVEAKKSVDIKNISLEQSEENLQLVQDQFDNGRMNTKDLLEAQTLWQQAKTEQTEALAELRKNILELKKTIGELPE